MPQSNNIDFDKKLDDILKTSLANLLMKNSNNTPAGVLTDYLDDIKKEFKQLVSTHIIGNNASERALIVADSIKYPQLKFMNTLKDEQRKALGLHKGDSK